MISVFLGAGFSAAAGVPLASQLFDAMPEVDGVTREHLVQRVLDNWRRWSAVRGGAPEEYLASLQEGGGREWQDAQWYVGLVIALRMGRVERVGMRFKITRHNLDRTTGVEAHELFWTTIFRRTSEVSVVTTNYDVLPERGIRPRPRPRVCRPGFHYGEGSEQLEGGGYPSYAHIQRIKVSGSVPILKLHGSVSWSYRSGLLVHYHDCRPAIRGDAAIVAPVTTKALPPFLEPVWEHARKALRSSSTWVVVGYSLPAYDQMVRHLLADSAISSLRVHVFDPDESVATRFGDLLGAGRVIPHPGLPEGLPDISAVVAQAG
jgi:hypothetical protein